MDHSPQIFVGVGAPRTAGGGAAAQSTGGAAIAESEGEEEQYSRMPRYQAVSREVHNTLNACSKQAMLEYWPSLIITLEDGGHFSHVYVHSACAHAVGSGLQHVLFVPHGCQLHCTL